MKVNYAIVFVSDMKRSVAFYRDVIGIPVRFDTPDWTEFDTDGTTLALHKAESSKEEVHQQSPAGRCRPGFGIANIEEFHQRMVDHKVRCIQEPKDTYGVKIAQYVDPDGLVFTVSGNHH